MKQLTLATVGFERYAKTTRRAAFLAEMERVVPWSALCALIEPFYANPGNGRPPVGVERMLRIYFLQQWFNLSDPAVEEALYDSLAMRHFVGIDLGREPFPTRPRCAVFATCSRRTIWLFDEGQRHLAATGMKVATGTIVDATIINAPSSTKNADKARDPDMHQTNKGNQWYFGMKAHFGVDSRTKLIHAVAATPANVADSTVLPELLHGRETRVWGDQAYRGQRAVIREHAPKARDFTNRRYRHRGAVDVSDRWRTKFQDHNRYVLDLLLAHVLEGKAELVAHLIAHDPADADPTGLGQDLERCSDINPIAVDIAPVPDEVADIYPHPELHTGIWRHIGVS
jgi:IS5 family transposase